MKFLYTKSQTLRKKQDNLPYVYIYIKPHTLRYEFFHGIFEIGGGGLYAKNNALCVKFLYAKNNALCITFLYRIFARTNGLISWFTSDYPQDGNFF